MILCSPEPTSARRLKDIDRAATLRAYCLARLEEHLGPLRERKLACRKAGCDRKRLEGANHCLEHVIADRFGRHLARLEPVAESQSAGLEHVRGELGERRALALGERHVAGHRSRP